MLTRSEHGIRFRDLVHCCLDQSPRSLRASPRWAQVSDNRRGVIPAAIRNGQDDEKPVVSDIFCDFQASPGIRHRLPNTRKTPHSTPDSYPIPSQFRPEFGDPVDTGTTASSGQQVLKGTTPACGIRICACRGSAMLNPVRKSIFKSRFLVIRARKSVSRILTQQLHHEGFRCGRDRLVPCSKRRWLMRLNGFNNRVHSLTVYPSNRVRTASSSYIVTPC